MRSGTVRVKRPRPRQSTSPGRIPVEAATRTVRRNIWCRPSSRIGFAANVLIPHIYAASETNGAVHHEDLAVIAQIEDPTGITGSQEEMERFGSRPRASGPGIDDRAAVIQLHRTRTGSDSFSSLGDQQVAKPVARFVRLKDVIFEMNVILRF